MVNMEQLQMSKQKQRTELQNIVSSGSLTLQVQELQEKVGSLQGRGLNKASLSLPPFSRPCLACF